MSSWLFCSVEQIGSWPEFGRGFQQHILFHLMTTRSTSKVIMTLAISVRGSYLAICLTFECLNACRCIKSLLYSAFVPHTSSVVCFMKLTATAVCKVAVVTIIPNQMVYLAPSAGRAITLVVDSLSFCCWLFESLFSCEHWNIEGCHSTISGSCTNAMHCIVGIKNRWCANQNNGLSSGCWKDLW